MTLTKFYPRLSPLPLLLLLLTSCEIPAGTDTHLPQKDSTSWGDKMKVIWSVPRISGGDASWGMGAHTASLLTPDKAVFLYDRSLHAVSRATGETLWQKSLPANSWDTRRLPTYLAHKMLLEGNRLYVVGVGFVECRDITSGAQHWRFEADNDFNWDFNRLSQSSIALYLSTHQNDELIAISKASGAVLWTNPNASRLSGSDPFSSYAGPATYHNGVVYVGSTLYPGTSELVHQRGGGLSAFDANSGKLLWRKILPDPDSSIIDYTRWQLLASNRADAIVYALENGLVLTAGFTVTKTDFEGNVLWRRAIHHEGTTSELTQASLLNGSTLYTYNNGDGAGAFITSIDVNDASKKWQSLVSHNGSIHTVLTASPFLDGNTIYKTTNDNWLFGHDVTTGSLVRAYLLDAAEFAGDQRVPYVGALNVESNRIYFINASNILCMEKYNE